MNNKNLVFKILFLGFFVNVNLEIWSIEKSLNINGINKTMRFIIVKRRQYMLSMIFNVVLHIENIQDCSILTKDVFTK